MLHLLSRNDAMVGSVLLPTSGFGTDLGMVVVVLASNFGCYIFRWFALSDWIWCILMIGFCFCKHILCLVTAGCYV